MMLAVRVKDDEERLIREYARLHSLSISEFVRNAVLEKIEDEIDLKAYNQAMEKFKENPITYTLDEIETKYGI